MEKIAGKRKRRLLTAIIIRQFRRRRNMSESLQGRLMHAVAKVGRSIYKQTCVFRIDWRT